MSEEQIEIEIELWDSYTSIYNSSLSFMGVAFMGVEHFFVPLRLIFMSRF
jgi:hypothetical protein